MEYFFLIVFVIMLIMYISSNKSNKSVTQKEERRNYMYSESYKFVGVRAVQKIEDYSGESRIIIDEKKNKFYIIGCSQGKKIPTKIYDYKDLLEVEILEDGDSITKTARGSQIGGILIGGLALGGVGAVIGGLSGKKKQIDTVRQIDLKLIINDLNNPLFVLNVFTHDPGLKKTSADYIKYKEQSNKWHSLLTVIIKKADEMDNKKNKTDHMHKTSIADEIIKLKNLKDEGILSTKEFEEQKKKLLSS